MSAWQEKIDALWPKIAARINHEESKVIPHPLPPVCGAGGRFDEARRAEILALFERCMYGKIPPPPDRFELIVRENTPGALGGRAIRRRIDLVCSMNNGRRAVLPMLLYLPQDVHGKVPCFFGLNFQTNATTTVEDIPLTSMPSEFGFEPAEIRLYDGKGPKQLSRWDFEEVIGRGFASATIWYGSLFPDVPDGFPASILALFMSQREWDSPTRNTGAISAWSWGVERALDALTMLPEIDGTKLIVHGHSRLGKTALWSGANDPRAALVISSCSGCCGASLLRRNFGEGIEHITTFFPHWFVPGLQDYAQRDHELPLDQNLLLSCIAPRPLAVGSATEDLHADPLGEFLSLRSASEVYRLCGRGGLPQDCTMPEPDRELCGDGCSYHIRTGIHDITPADWKIYMDFAERELLK